MQPTDRLADAFTWALDLHRTQQRKGTEIPYVSHLMSVCALVLEHGGDEDQAIAALLHDAVEDQGGRPVLQQIRERYGAEVAAIVDACTDAYTDPKPPWRERKEAYVAHIGEASEAARRVSAADKLHNARAILADYRSDGEALWQRFRAGREELLWYYLALTEAFEKAGNSRLVEELALTVGELKRLVDERQA